MIAIKNDGQCKYYVVRKKRLCRMTVKPGRQYCGEHEPQPTTVDDKDDLRVPCPYDPKHTCFASKLEKHLKICNARETELPEYIVHNINASADDDACPRVPLTDIPTKKISTVIDKINLLFQEVLKDKIVTLPEKSIHKAVAEEFNEAGRAESSLRHLRQVSSLLHLMEDQGMVQPNTCYVELGAGKGRLAAMMWHAWCAGADSDDGKSVLLVERAALRHKRDNSTSATRLRADLAHVVLAGVTCVRDADGVVGVAKHLCGVATDYAIRCLCADSVVAKVRGVALATCCHHRCLVGASVGDMHLHNYGITPEEFNIILGIVSWATCGDGRSRDKRKQNVSNETVSHDEDKIVNNDTNEKNINIDLNTVTDSRTVSVLETNQRINSDKENILNVNSKTIGADLNINSNNDNNDTKLNSEDLKEEIGTKTLRLGREDRELVGRRAKALIDWGRILYLRERGFDAQLVYYVPSTVSLENLCIVAKKV